MDISESISGLIFESRYQSRSVFIISEFALGSFLAKSPQKTPTMDAPLSNAKFSGREGIGPDAKPTKPLQQGEFYKGIAKFDSLSTFEVEQEKQTMCHGLNSERDFAIDFKCRFN